MWAHSGTVRWKSVVEQWNNHGGNVMVEQSWWNTSHGGTLWVEQWNIDGGTVWWNSGTLMVEQCKEIVEQ